MVYRSFKLCAIVEVLVTAVPAALDLYDFAGVPVGENFKDDDFLNRRVTEILGRSEPLDVVKPNQVVLASDDEGDHEMKLSEPPVV